jgi:hypothetical protein
VQHRLSTGVDKKNDLSFAVVDGSHDGKDWENTDCLFCAQDQSLVETLTHRLNMELHLQSLVGLYVT